MKKIIFGITSLNAGGAERVLIDLANKLSREFSITIFTIYGRGDFESQLNEKIELRQMVDKKYEELTFLERKMLSLKLLIPYFRKKIISNYINDKYDAYIAFLEGPITWLFSRIRGSKIAWIHNDISLVFGSSLASFFKKKMNEVCYKKYKELVFVSKDNLQKFDLVFPTVLSKKHVIYNYVDTDLVINKSKSSCDIEFKNDVINFVQVSRLVNQKAISRLISVHKKLIVDGFKHRIYIIGDGPLKEELLNKIKEEEISDSFVLLGKKDNPYPYILKCDVFMLTSYYEGYPMVLLEAKVLNKFILLTDSAAREVLTDYNHKKIVKNNDKGIYDGIKKLILNPPKKNLTGNFKGEDILEEIKNLLKES